MVQVKLHRLLEKTKKKKEDKGNLTKAESDDVVKEQEKLRKKVIELIKRKKLAAVWKIVKGHDDTKPWGEEASVKVA